MLRPTPTRALSLQYACGVKAEVVGKPSPEFFRSALRELGVEAHQVGCLADADADARGGSCVRRGPHIPPGGLGAQAAWGRAATCGPPTTRADLAGNGEKAAKEVH